MTKEYQGNYRKAKKTTKFFICIFFHCIKMRKELVLKIKNNYYTKDKYYFQKDKSPININEVDTEKIVLSNKTPYGKNVVINTILLI